MEIETDKTTVGVPSPSHGIIEEIYVQDGDTVKAHQNLFKLNVTGEAPKKAAATEAAPALAAAAPPPTVAAPKPVAAAAQAPPPSVSAPPPPPPRPTAPASSIPVAAIRHAQSIENATVKVQLFIFFLIEFFSFLFKIISIGTTSRLYKRNYWNKNRTAC